MVSERCLAPLAPTAPITAPSTAMGIPPPKMTTRQRFVVFSPKPWRPLIGKCLQDAAGRVGERLDECGECGGLGLVIRRTLWALEELLGPQDRLQRGQRT